jgi:hypothetical protein
LCKQPFDPRQPGDDVFHHAVDKIFLLGVAIDWGEVNYVNPPFRREDGVGGKGTTAFFRKAIEQHRKGKTVVLVAPTQPYVNVMLEAGAELRSLGRVRWLDVDTGAPCSAPGPVTCFILRY